MSKTWNQHLELQPLLQSSSGIAYFGASTWFGDRRWLDCRYPLPLRRSRGMKGLQNIRSNFFG
jgi:hypothetical protein